MIPYTVGKLAPNSSHLTRGLVKYVPGRGYFRSVSSYNGEKYVTPPPPIVEFVFLAVPRERCPAPCFRVCHCFQNYGNLLFRGLDPEGARDWLLR